MNTLKAQVTQIQSSENISIVTFESFGCSLRMMSLGLNTSISVGSKVMLGFKSSSVALAKEIQGSLSISNRLHSKVTRVNNGALLSNIKLDFYGAELQSVITLDSSLSMNIEVGDEIVALIKSSELSILKVLQEGM